MRLFIAKLFDDAPVLPFIRSSYEHAQYKGESTFFHPEYLGYQYKNIILVRTIEESDYILIPQGVRSLSPKRRAYIESYISQGKIHNKKVVMFPAGDLHHDVYMDEAIVMKALNYRSLKRKNEIYIPVAVEDLLRDRTLELREKTSDIPVVGFCGWAGVANTTQWLKYHLKNLSINIQKIVRMNPKLEVYKKGIYFRKKASHILSESPLIKTNFIFRTSYSGHKGTISLDPEQARREFIENIVSSDLVLTPKGDGNSSARFYEVLSLGRIPILLDTEIILPLENVIDYSKFMLRVDYTNIKDLATIVSDFYTKLSSEEFKKMQLAAREAFEKYLRYDSFFEYVFSGPLERLLSKN